MATRSLPNAKEEPNETDTCPDNVLGPMAIRSWMEAPTS